jgi:hypothetical protein
VDPFQRTQYPALIRNGNVLALGIMTNGEVWDRVVGFVGLLFCPFRVEKLTH